MHNILIVGICFLAGIVLRTMGRVPENGARCLNQVVIHISMPAVALLAAHEMPISISLAFPIAAAWLMFGFAWLLFKGISLVKPMAPATFGCLMLTAALGNTSFVGLPMIEAFYGPEWTWVGVVCDQPGTFLALVFPGMIIAATLTTGSITARSIFTKVLRFPPIQAFILGLALRFVEYPDWATGALKGLGNTLTPLALLSVGMSLRSARIGDAGFDLTLGLLFKLILAPAATLLLYAGAFGQSGTEFQIIVFEMAMPPMVTGGIIATEHNLNPRLASLLLGIGIPLSFIVLPLWHWLLLGF